MARTSVGVVVVLVLGALLGQLQAEAGDLHMELQVGGNQIHGASSVASLDRADTIECLSFDLSFERPHDPVTGEPMGGRRCSPIVIRKYIDRTTPLLAMAAASSLTDHVDVTFRFFGPHPDGAGEEVELYRVVIWDAHISRIHQELIDRREPGAWRTLPTEEITFVFEHILWEWFDTRHGVISYGDPLVSREAREAGDREGTAPARRILTTPRIDMRKAPVKKPPK